MEKINIEDILVVKKKSRLEVDAMQLGLDWEKIREEDSVILGKISKRYHCEKFVTENIEAHRELYSFIDFISSLGFLKSDIVEREQFASELLDQKKAVLVLGGDNHKVWILNKLHYFGKDLPVLGCNTDLKRSDGAILHHNKNNLEENLEKLSHGNYFVEEWPKIEGKIFFNGNRKELFPAVQEYFLGEYPGSQCSRWYLIDGKKEELQRGNCLVIANGVGITARYSSAHLGLFQRVDELCKRTSKEIRYIIDGPFGGKEKYKFPKGIIKEGQVLEIISYNDDYGVIKTDSIDEPPYIHEFPMGAKAKIWISDKVSRIIRTD